MKSKKFHCLVLMTRIYIESNENDGLAIGFQIEL